jgi:hypothetical protein
MAGCYYYNRLAEKFIPPLNFFVDHIFHIVDNICMNERNEHNTNGKDNDMMIECSEKEYNEYRARLEGYRVDITIIDLMLTMLSDSIRELMIENGDDPVTMIRMLCDARKLAVDDMYDDDPVLTMIRTNEKERK